MTRAIAINLTETVQTLVLVNASDTAITGSGGATVFGSSSYLSFNASPGLLVLGAGGATIAGSDLVFGGTGTIDYFGTSGVGDVIGGRSGHDTISAASSGWFEGGSQGMNLIQGSNSGLGTVLQAGGAGDHLVGGAAGGDYFLAGSGNETLTGGNNTGTQVMFGGIGTEVVQLGVGHAIIDTGTGTMSITGAGYSTIWEAATGGSLTLNASAGIQAVYGFRVGVDAVNLSGGGWSDTQSNGTTTLTSALTGTTYHLHGVLAPLGALT